MLCEHEKTGTSAVRQAIKQLDIWLRSFFFFQAEDGIRDLTVTGVQTCALPISCAAPGAATVRNARNASAAGATNAAAAGTGNPCGRRFGAAVRNPLNRSRSPQIGRASCRERV